MHKFSRKTVVVSGCIAVGVVITNATQGVLNFLPILAIRVCSMLKHKAYENNDQLHTAKKLLRGLFRS